MVGRAFQFVEYGQSYKAPSPEDSTRPTISCDGRIPGGVTLELTHWTDNETPDDLYADTSTEMALKLAATANDKKYAHLNQALVLNNHFDTDGVLSVWACLEPALALQYADLLRQGAEAGDFGEWSSDAGVKLDCALTALCDEAGDESAAYARALQELPRLLRDLTDEAATSASSYQSLWELGGWKQAMEDWQALQELAASLERVSDELVILREPATGRRVSPYALHRGLVEQDWSPHWILRVSSPNSDNNHGSTYELEKVGHGWVQKLVQRRVVPNVDTARLVQQLNSIDACWKTGGASGLVAICRTTRPLPSSRLALEVAESILQAMKEPTTIS